MRHDAKGHQTQQKKKQIEKPPQNQDKDAQQHNPQPQSRKGLTWGRLEMAQETLLVNTIKIITKPTSWQQLI